MDASGLIKSLKDNPTALGLSIALHIALFIMLGISIYNSEVPSQKISDKETVKAYVVEADVVEREIKKLKQAENKKNKKIKKETDKLKRQLNKEKKRLAKIKKEKRELERKAAEKKKADKKKEINRKKSEEQKKKEIARKKLETEKAEKRRKAEEKELKRRLEEEERILAKHNDMLRSLRSQYVRLIEQKVERNWLRPATVSSDLTCEVFVTQSVLGDVINVRLGACASDAVFRNSIERAVRKSSPLPPPPNPEVFDREIRFVFKPDK